MRRWLAIFGVIGLGCNSSEFSSDTIGLKTQNLNVDPQSSDTLPPPQSNSQTSVIENEELDNSTAIVEEASEPVSIGGAFLTCRSHGFNYDKQGSGVSCLFLSETNQRPRADDGRTYSFQVLDATSQAALPAITFPALATEPNSDWYLVVTHSQTIRSIDVILSVASTASNELLYKFKYRVPVISDLSNPSLSLTGTYQNLTFGGGSYATAGSTNTCAPSSNIPVVREGIDLQIPTGGTTLTLSMDQVCDVGAPTNLKTYLAVPLQSFAELYQGTVLVQRWTLPEATAKFELKTSKGLAAGSYKLMIRSGHVEISPSYAKGLSTMDFDNFSIGSMKISASAPIGVTKPTSRQGVVKELPGALVVNVIGDGLLACAALSQSMSNPALNTSILARVYPFEMTTDGEFSLFISGICGMDSSSNYLRISDSTGTIVFSDALGFSNNIAMNQYSTQVPLTRGTYTMTLGNGRYSSGSVTRFDDFGVGKVRIQGPLR